MKKLCVTALALAVTSVAHAGTQPYFTPLTQSTAVATANHPNELNSPWQTPAGFTQEQLTSMAEIEADISQSTVRSPGLGSGASMWDMVAFDDKGEYVFIPHETAYGAGVSRYDIANDFTEILFSGDNTGVRGSDTGWENDWGAFDPATFTPYGTVLLGEEWSGEGRVMEVLNPLAPAAEIKVVEKHSFANVSQEGIRFGKVNENVVYYVDEDRSGSIYKFVAEDPQFNKGQTFVLAVDAFDGDSSQRFDRDPNIGKTRVGQAKWVAMTDVDGNPVTTVNPFDGSGSTRPGRVAADELGATPYGRPEDVEVGVLANGNEVLYFTATSEQAVYSVEMMGAADAMVREFASEANTPKNLGFEPTTGFINSPDNLAQDAFGNIYIIEDAPNGSDVGGDIWFVRDTDNDGVAESVDHFMSIQVNGAEATGMIFNPAKPSEFVVSVQHPSSTNLDNVAGGQGDALWKFDITDVVPPTCDELDEKSNWSKAVGRYIKTCSHAYDFSFTDVLWKIENNLRYFLKKKEW